MEQEEIKVGEKYNFTLIATGKAEYGLPATFETPTGRQVIIRPDDFEAVSPANGIKNTEPEPKYDPRRKFRKGDIVEPCEVKGRWFGTAWKNRSGIQFTVTKDEDEEGVMWVEDPDSLHPKDVEAVFFQLATPVEELEQHSIEKAVMTRDGLEEVIHKHNLWLEDKEVGERANLEGVDLRCVDLCGVNLGESILSEAKLRCARLRGADLHMARLDFANLENADLRGANFIEADLGCAKLCLANLSGADFRGAFMIGVDLRNAILCGANLTGANLSHADLRGAGLRGVKMSKKTLETVALTEVQRAGIIIVE